mmetsp:Transcript_7948/g.19055  ORF Transcript_7948/g.19055 Transcript_7948/m.19055 type:complete len:210 (-) Transcript_7948:33-662(-)
MAARRSSVASSSRLEASSLSLRGRTMRHSCAESCRTACMQVVQSHEVCLSKEASIVLRSAIAESSEGSNAFGSGTESSKWPQRHVRSSRFRRQASRRPWMSSAVRDSSSSCGGRRDRSDSKRTIHLTIACLICATSLGSSASSSLSASACAFLAFSSVSVADLTGSTRSRNSRGSQMALPARGSSGTRLSTAQSSLYSFLSTERSLPWV